MTFQLERIKAIGLSVILSPILLQWEKDNNLVTLISVLLTTIHKGDVTVKRQSVPPRHIFLSFANTVVESTLVIRLQCRFS